MKQILLAVILVIATQAAVGQITYEPGYFISNDGKRTECEIKNQDWKNNPTSFDYRVGTTDGKGDIETVSEFGTTAGSVFRRFAVNIDRSSTKTAAATKSRIPEFKRETLFLRLLVNGKAVLYMYDDNGLVRFFSTHDGSDISQLVYKKYLQTDERGFETGYVAENEQYKQDLFNQLKCASITEKDVKSLKYERAPLMKFFNQYNECTGTLVKTNEAETPKAPIHFSLLAGVGFNSLRTSNGSAITDYGSGTAFRFGAELEIVLPFNKGMWAFAIQPVYQSYSTEHPVSKSKFSYSSLDLGGSFRRYLFIKGDNSMYASLGAVWAFPTSDLGGTALNMTAGVGYHFSKFSAEVSYGFKRDIQVAYQSEYGGVMVMLGYRLK